MTFLAPLLEAFFSERLLRQRRASSHTVAAYRDAFRLLLSFAEARLHKAPSTLHCIQPETIAEKRGQRTLHL